MNNNELNFSNYNNFENFSQNSISIKQLIISKDSVIGNDQDFEELFNRTDDLTKNYSSEINEYISDELIMLLKMDNIKSELANILDILEDELKIIKENFHMNKMQKEIENKKKESESKKIIINFSEDLKNKFNYFDKIFKNINKFKEIYTNIKFENDKLKKVIDESNYENLINNTIKILNMKTELLNYTDKFLQLFREEIKNFNHSKNSENKLDTLKINSFKNYYLILDNIIKNFGIENTYFTSILLNLNPNNQNNNIDFLDKEQTFENEIDSNINTEIDIFADHKSDVKDEKDNYTKINNEIKEKFLSIFQHNSEFIKNKDFSRDKIFENTNFFNEKVNNIKSTDEEFDNIVTVFDLNKDILTYINFLAIYICLNDLSDEDLEILLLIYIFYNSVSDLSGKTTNDEIIETITNDVSSMYNKIKIKYVALTEKEKSELKLSKQRDEELEKQRLKEKIKEKVELKKIQEEEVKNKIIEKKAEEYNKIIEETKRKDAEITKGIEPKSFFQKYMIYIIIVVLLLLGVIGFFMFSGKSGGSDMDFDF